MNPKVTVVIPYYNMGEFIAETLESVKRQSYKGEIEVILVDDGSEDPKSILEVERIIKEGWPQVLRQKNAGLSAARNAGTRKAKGEYVACLDADDIYDPDFIKKCVAVLDGDKEKKLGFVTTWVQSFGASDELWETEDYNDQSKIKILAQNIVHGNSMFRKEAWEKAGGYNETMKKGYEDWDFWIGVMEAGYIWDRIPEPLFNYRKRPGSMLTCSVQIHDELYGRLVDNHPKIYEKYHKELIKLLASMVNDRELIIRERNKFIGGKMFTIYDSLKKVATRPKRVLDPKNYRKFVKRISKK